MSSPISEKPKTATSSDLPRPLYFGEIGRRVFGWFHTAAGQTSSSTGVVICKPFGFEAMSAHLSMRAFAEAAAEAGVPTLLFDYGGTGDSEDLHAGADQVAAWIEDIVAAVQELQARTGVERVALLGIRLGALLAAAAAARLPQVGALLAITPIMSGRRYLKELRMFELASAQTQSALLPASTQFPSEEAQLAGPGHMEVNGFFLNASTISALQQLEASELTLSSVTDAFFIDRDDLPGALAWSEKLSAAGVRSKHAALPGFVGMIMRPPNLTTAPQEMIAAAQEWLAQLNRPSSVRVLNEPGPQTVRLGTAADAIDEQPILLRNDPLLFGIATHPAKNEVRRRGVILLNSGGDHHVGPRRMHVWLARRWARRGYVVMRMDLSGLGDSAAQPGEERNELFPAAAVGDIRVAVDYMVERFALNDVTLVGMCSGASHAVRAGMEGVRIDRVLAINPLVFFWENGLDVNDVQPWEVVHKPAAYMGQIFSLKAWRRLLFGDVSVWRVMQIYLARPIMALQTVGRKFARGLHIRVKNDLGKELKDLKGRGVRVVFVFSRGDAGMRLLQIQSGLSITDLEKKYRIRTIDGADHEFTRSKARAALGQALSEELFAFHDVADGAASANDSGDPVRGQAVRQ